MFIGLLFVILIYLAPNKIRLLCPQSFSQSIFLPEQGPNLGLPLEHRHR